MIGKNRWTEAHTCLTTAASITYLLGQLWEADFNFPNNLVGCLITI